MSDSSRLQECIRKEGICALFKIEDLQGKAVTGVVVEGQLEAIAIYLKGSIGAEAAFNVLTRHAEEIIRPSVNAAVKQP